MVTEVMVLFDSDGELWKQEHQLPVLWCWRIVTGRAKMQNTI